MISYEFLCCPLCKGDLEFGAAALKCLSCAIDYPVLDGIPVLVDPAQKSAHLEGQIRFFDRQARRRPPYILCPWMRSYLERFKDAFPGFTAGTAVDCGTGFGYMAVELARMGFNVIAFDITMQNLVNLQEQLAGMDLAGEMHLVCCDAQKLPLKAATADVMVSIWLLEHLPHEMEAISEMNRVSKPDARLMIGLPLKYRYLNPLLIPVHYFYDKYVGHLRRYNEAGLSASFEEWDLVGTYYTGQFLKTAKTGANKATKLFTDELFSEDKIEVDDRKKENHRYGATNMACMYARRPATGTEQS